MLICWLMLSQFRAVRNVSGRLTRRRPRRRSFRHPAEAAQGVDHAGPPPLRGRTAQKRRFGQALGRQGFVGRCPSASRRCGPKAQKLRQVRRGDDHGDPVLAHPADQPVKVERAPMSTPRVGSSRSRTGGAPPARGRRGPSAGCRPKARRRPASPSDARSRTSRADVGGDPALVPVVKKDPARAPDARGAEGRRSRHGAAQSSAPRTGVRAEHRPRPRPSVGRGPASGRPSRPRRCPRAGSAPSARAKAPPPRPDSPATPSTSPRAPQDQHGAAVRQRGPRPQHDLARRRGAGRERAPRSRPVISSMMRSWPVSPAARDDTTAPSRSTVTRCASRSPRPSGARRRAPRRPAPRSSPITANSRSASAPVRAAVGSSMT
jgi:hypothetical protein